LREPPDQSNPWQTLDTRRFYESTYLEMEEDTVRHRSGRTHAYTAVRFRVHGIAVVPILHDGCTCLIGQYRYLAKQFTWELPRGSDPKSVPAVETAKRELAEEAGLRKGKWLELFRPLVSPGVTDERAPCFVAWDLDEIEPTTHPEEELTIRRIAFRDAVTAATDGTICDAASIATILALHTRLLRGDLPEDLLRVLRSQV
jgi:8-oxo-dGTP pyrophosphatase MutT (NUDIX family)